MTRDEILEAVKDEALWREKVLVCLGQVAWSTKAAEQGFKAVAAEVQRVAKEVESLRGLLLQLSTGFPQPRGSVGRSAVEKSNDIFHPNG